MSAAMRRKCWSKTVGEYGWRVRLMARGLSGRLSVRWWDPSISDYRQAALGHSDRRRGLEEAKHIAYQIQSALRAAGLDNSVRRRLEADDRSRQEKLFRQSVYVLRNATSGLIKIGLSCDVRRRLKSLSHQAGLQLELLGSIRGGYELEAELHARFEKERLIGEWFRPGVSMLAWIATLEQEP